MTAIPHNILSRCQKKGIKKLASAVNGGWKLQNFSLLVSVFQLLHVENKLIERGWNSKPKYFLMTLD